MLHEKPELQEQYKAGNRDAKRKLINSLIPHEAGYNVRIDLASVERVLSRMVLPRRFKGHKGIEEGKTLTEMEATWGEKYVELRLERGDIRISEA